MSTETQSKLKRKKSAAFNKEDEIRLLNAIYTERQVVENKETSKYSNQEKDKAWSRILTVYNAASTEFRNMDQLKSKFDNLKTKTRKVVAHERAHLRRTGGGGAILENFDIVVSLVLKIINEKTVVGLTNTFDSDAYNMESNDSEIEAKTQRNLIEQAEVVWQIPEEENLAVLTDNILGSDVEETRNSVSYSKDDQQGEKLLSERNKKHSSGLQAAKSNDVKWDSYTPRKLKEPINRKLRPTTASSLAMAKEDYYKKKMKLMEEECQLRKNADRREEENHKGRLELLNLEIEIKREELNQLKQKNTKQDLI